MEKPNERNTPEHLGKRLFGTKSQVPENMGPMGKKNMFYTYGNTRCKEITLYFDFLGN
jgi:hypothetical protein